MTRPLVTFAALSTVALFACRTPDRDRDSVIDETGENENCPGCFDVAGMLWNLQGALSEGDLHPVTTTSGQRPALLTVMLTEPEYAATDTPNPDDYACTMTYTPSIQQGTQPGAVVDWQIALEPLENGCPDLDPDWVDDQLYTMLAQWGMEMIGTDLDSVMEGYLRGWFEDLEQDWQAGGAPYYFGLNSRIDGRVVYREDDTADGAAGEEIQGHYGRAFAVDGDLNILDEASGGRLLTVEEIGEGTDAWFEIYARTFFVPYERLR